MYFEIKRPAFPPPANSRNRAPRDDGGEASPPSELRPASRRRAGDQ
jgi:hypothetical protein